MKYISENEKDTINFAKQYAKTLSKGDIVLLFGDLGSGKTVFVKGIVEYFSGDIKDVTSPTFTIVNEYDVGKFKINHFDFYRIKNIEELYNIGIEEYLYSDGICFIEWPERANELFDSSCKIVKISKIDDKKRLIEY